MGKKNGSKLFGAVKGGSKELKKTSKGKDLSIKQLENDASTDSSANDIRAPNKFAPINEDKAREIIGKRSRAYEINQLVESETRKKKKELRQRRKRKKKLLVGLKTLLKALLLLGGLFLAMLWWKQGGFNFTNSKLLQQLQIIFATAKDEVRKINIAYDHSLDADAWTRISEQPDASLQGVASEEVDCHQVLSARSIADLANRLTFAECAYLGGDIKRSYEALAPKAAVLKQEAVLLYVMILLKRFEFSKAKNFLAGKCKSGSRSSKMFFPCLAEALYQVTVNGGSGIGRPPKNENSNNPYAAIYWLVEFIKTGSVDLSDDSIQNAISIASAAQRPAALAYIYEVLASHFYLKGSEDSFKQLESQARRMPRLGDSIVVQWIETLSKAKSIKFSNGKAYSVVEMITNGIIKLCDHMNFLDTLAYTGIRDGRSREVREELRGIDACYQRRGWRNSDGFRAVSEWRIRVEIAVNKHKTAAKLLRKYRSSHGESRFYHHYYGALRLKILRSKVKFELAADSLNKSIAKRESWQSIYCLALLHFHKGKYDAAQGYIEQVRSRYPKSAYGSWLSILENEILISRGEIDKATSNLIAHLGANHSSFRAYELLILIYRRTNETEKAAELQVIFNKVIRNIPYYSTREGALSPIGALALI